MTPTPPAVVDASRRVADWEEAKTLLMMAFSVSQDAARKDTPIVYIIHGDDLLGRRGAPSAMVATGLLSAARTAALELAGRRVPVNVVAVGDETELEVRDRWVLRLAEPDGPTGEVIRLDPGHIGKALP
jgi:hypothetical protein